MRRALPEVTRFVRGDLVLRVRRRNAVGTPLAGPTIVLVHGIGVSSRYFFRLAAELANSSTVIALELPGFGSNRRPGRQLAIEDFGALVADFLAETGTVAPILIGHSMGAQVVVDTATRHPVSGLVLLGPVVDERASTLWQQAMRLFRDTFHETPGANWIVFSDYLRSGIRWFATELPAMLSYRIEQELPHVDAPVLIIRGAKDTVAPEGWAHALAQRSARSRVVSVPHAAHVVQHTQATAVAAEIDTFASDVWPISRRDAAPAFPDASAGGAEQQQGQVVGPSRP